MADRVQDPDPITPTSIEHPYEEIFFGETLDMTYNYICYRFDRAEAWILAYAYLDEPGNVLLFRPQGEAGPDADALEADAMAYLQRRYERVNRPKPMDGN